MNKKQLIKFFASILLLIFFFSCHQSEKPKPNFKFVDVSWNYSMINKLYSMRIDSDAVAIMRIIAMDSTYHYYTNWFRDTLNENEINFLNKEVSFLKNKKVDPIITRYRIDGSGATIIIQTDSAQILAQLSSSENTNESFNPLVDFIKAFSKDSCFIPTDSINIFEKLDENIFPPPPPKTIKFSLPIINTGK